MASYNVAKPQGPSVAYTDDNTIYVNSDRYFNNSSHAIRNLEAFGMDVQPVDVFGGFVPQNKSLSNLKKAEKAIQERFGLEKPE